MIQTTGVTIGEVVELRLTNTEVEICGEVHTDSFAEETKFSNKDLAKILRLRDFDAEKDNNMSEALLSAFGKNRNDQRIRANANMVNNLKSKELRAAEKELKKVRSKNSIYLYNKKTRKFPIGLLERCKQYLDKEGITYKVVDNRVVPTKEFDYKFVNEKKIPRDYQIKGAEFTDQHSHILYDWATNSGKTMLMALIVQRRGLKTLILTHSGAMTYQLRKEIKEHLGVTPTISTAGKVNLSPITIATVKTARNYVAQFKDYGFSVIMIDEAHRSAAVSYVVIVKQVQPYYSFGFTGSPERKSVDRIVLEANYGRFLPRISNKDMIDAGFSCPVEIDFREYIADEDIKKTDPYHLVYKNQIVNSTKFNTEIVSAVLSYLEDDRVVAVQVAQKAQGRLLHATLKELGVKSVLVDGDENPKENYDRLEGVKSGKYEVAIGTVINESWDCDRLDVAVNAAGYMDAKLTKQKLGRILRTRPGKTSATFVDFYFRGSPVLEKHSRRRAETLEKEGLKIPVLDKVRAEEAEELRLMNEEHARLNKKFEEVKHMQGQMKSAKMTKKAFINNKDVDQEIEVGDIEDLV